MQIFLYILSWDAVIYVNEHVHILDTGTEKPPNESEWVTVVVEESIRSYQWFLWLA